MRDSTEVIKEMILNNQEELLERNLENYFSQSKNRGFFSFIKSAHNPDFKKLLNLAIRNHKNNAVRALIKWHEKLDTITIKTWETETTSYFNKNSSFNDIQKSVTAQRTSVYVAVESNNFDALKMLVESKLVRLNEGLLEKKTEESGSDIIIKVSPLYLAIKLHNEKLALYICEQLQGVSGGRAGYFEHIDVTIRESPIWAAIEEKLINVAYKLGECMWIEGIDGRFIGKKYTSPAQFAAIKGHKDLCKFLNEKAGLLLSSNRWIKVYVWDSKSTGGIGHASIEASHDNRRSYVSVWPGGAGIQDVKDAAVSLFIKGEAAIAKSLKEDISNELGKYPDQSFTIYSLDTEKIINQIIEIRQKGAKDIKYRLSGNRFFESGKDINSCSSLVYYLFQSGGLSTRFFGLSNITGGLVPNTNATPITPSNIAEMARKIEQFEKKYYPYISDFSKENIKLTSNNPIVAMENHAKLTPNKSIIAIVLLLIGISLWLKYSNIILGFFDQKGEPSSIPKNDDFDMYGKQDSTIEMKI